MLPIYIVVYSKSLTSMPDAIIIPNANGICSVNHANEI